MRTASMLALALFGCNGDDGSAGLEWLGQWLERVGFERFGIERGIGRLRVQAFWNRRPVQARRLNAERGA